jgi:hypothetical protein
MGDMIRQLGEKRLDRNALTSAIQDMVQAVITEQDGTRQRIRATLNPGDMTDSPLLKSLEYGTLSLDEVQKTTELLKELFQGEIPASIAEDLSTLERHSRVGRFLDEILNELRAGRDSKPDSPFPDQKDRAFTAQTAPEAQTGDPTRTSDHAFMEEQTSNSIRRNSSPLTPSGGRSSGEEGDAGDQDMEQDLFSGIGDAKARGTKKSPRELQDSKGLKIKEQGVSLVGEHYNAQVRSLTSIGKPEVDEGEILRHYEQEIEEVLQKEDMPLNYREYIKTYFLSIGLGRKNHANEGTH